MKKIWMLPLLFLTQLLFAQELDVKWGKNFKKDGTKEDEYGDCQFAFKATSNGEPMYVSRSVFDKCEELYAVKNSYLCNKTQFIQTQNHFYAIAKAPRKMYALEIGETGSMKGTPRVIADLNYTLNPNNAALKQLFYSDGSYCGTYVSPNQKMIGVLSTGHGKMSLKCNSISFAVSTEDITPVWKRTVDFDYDGVTMQNIRNTFLSDNGSMLLCVDVPKEKNQHLIKINAYQISKCL